MDIILSISLCANIQKVGAACYSAVQPSQAAQCHGSSFRLQHDLLFLAQETQPVIQCSTLHYSYILNSVRFQTKFNLVWKSNSKNVVTNFQTKPSLVWKLKMLSQISKPNPVWFGNFLCRICGGNKFQTKSSLVWKFSWLAIATLKPTFNFFGRDFAIFNTFTWQNPYQEK